MTPDNLGLDHKTQMEIAAGFLTLVTGCQVLVGSVMRGHRFVRRDDEPRSYWIGIGVWAAFSIAAYVFAY